MNGSKYDACQTAVSIPTATAQHHLLLLPPHLYIDAYPCVFLPLRYLFPTRASSPGSTTTTVSGVFFIPVSRYGKHMTHVPRSVLSCFSSSVVEGARAAEASRDPGESYFSVQLTNVTAPFENGQSIKNAITDTGQVVRRGGRKKPATSLIEKDCQPHFS